MRFSSKLSLPLQNQYLFIIVQYKKTMLLDQKTIETFYKEYAQKVAQTKVQLGRPLTYAEKILFSHGADPNIEKGQPVSLHVDRVQMQDATAQMALLQFILTGKEKVAVPTTIHCDHLIRAYQGANQDLEKARHDNDEVYQFLKSAANKYGIGFWGPGAGIIHQVFLEKYAFPGGLIIGTDSHTPNMGGLGMVAIGVGGADAVDAMAGLSWKVARPKLLGVHLKGKLSGWTSPKDIILKVAEILTVKGGTGFILEYFGEGARSISATGRGTITNMGAEIGATTSVFPYNEHSASYLRATDREPVASAADAVAAELRADEEVEQSPEKFFDKVIEIDLSSLEPMIVGPHTPDLARPISKLGEDVEKNDWDMNLKYCLIGSCTNSSYEDMQRAATIAKQAADKGMKVKCGFMVTPGSEQIKKTIERDGQMELFQKIGGVVLANACGPCIGMWNRTDIKKGDKNSILTSYNRNFPKRNDANPQTAAFIGSPEIVTAIALAGRLDFNPLTDELTAENGEKFVLSAPHADELPSKGFIIDQTGFHAPTGKGEVDIKDDSERLAFLDLFSEWKEGDFSDLFVLLKAKGKCTTDHISPAGPWLRYRGHLDKISDNMFSGAINAFTEEAGKGKNQLSGETQEFSAVARAYKEQAKGWIVIGDSNYGEGSSREHAAMEPRHLGCRAVIVKSFARIHETNLKKQGVLPLTFLNETDYDLIREDDHIDIPDTILEVGKNVKVMVKHSDGSSDEMETTHTLSEEQINWFNAGSALNHIRKG